MRTALRVFSLAGLVLVSLGGCASFGGGDGGLMASSGGSAADAPVRPGDQVILEIWNEAAMSDTFAVAQSGHIILPQLGALSVSGHSVESLQDSIRQAYTQYLRNPSVQIAVLRRVGISGAVRSPGVFMVDLTHSLPDLITKAGGLVESANPNNITVQRGTERIRFRSDDRNIFMLAELRSGDQIVVGHKNFIQRNPLAVVTTAVPLVGYIFTVIIPAIRNL